MAAGSEADSLALNVLTGDVRLEGSVARETLSFTQRLIGPVGEAADFLSDRIRFYRFKSAMRVLEEARRLTEGKGKIPREVPIKFLVPFLEKCSLEEEGSPLISMWAGLLASAATGSDRSRNHLFSRVLADLCPADAAILDTLYNASDERPDESPGHAAFDLHRLSLDSIIEDKLFDLRSDVSHSLRSVEEGDGFAALTLVVRDRQKQIAELLRAIEGYANSFGRKHVVCSFSLGYVNMRVSSSELCDDFKEINEACSYLEPAGLIEVRLHQRHEQLDRCGLWIDAKWIQLSGLGFDFVKACRGGANVQEDTDRQPR